MESDKQDLSIYERMIGILGELPAIGANQRNTQQNYNFRGYSDVLDALNPKLAEWGVFYVPKVLECRTEARQRSSGSGSMYVTRLHIEYTFYGAKGDSVAASAWGEGSDAGDKGTSKAMTGAMKYVLFQAYAISVSEAQDGDATSPDESRPVATATDLLAARKREWGDKPLPEGWEDYEAFDSAHQTFQVGMKNALAKDNAAIKEYIKEHEIPWPMTKPQMDEVLAYIERMGVPEGEPI